MCRQMRWGLGGERLRNELEMLREEWREGEKKTRDKMILQINLAGKYY